MSQRRIEDIVEVIDEFLFVIKSASNTEREKILSMVHLNMIQDMAYVAKQQPNLVSIGIISVPNTLSFICIKVPIISFCVITGFYMAKKVGWL